MSYFQNKVAIITGSSRGIGLSIAKELVANGALVMLNGRDENRLHAAQNSLSDVADCVAAFAGDVAIEETANALIAACLERFGKIDFLINNVGVSSRGNIGALSPSVFRLLFESNVMGSVCPTIAALPSIRQTKGSILFISSLVAVHGLPGLAPYSASKMSLRGIVESLRIEEAKNHIHVGLIYVGMTEIVTDKEAIAADGSTTVLASRADKKVQSLQEVSKAVLKQLRKRTYRSVLTPLGKINAFLQALFPLLVEKIILKNLHKFEEGNK